MVTTSGLAGHNGRVQDAHPAGKAHLKDVWVNQHEHPAEGVMGRNAIGQGEKLTPPRELAATLQGNVLPVLGTGDHRTDSNHQNIYLRVLNLVRTARIFQVGKPLNQLTDQTRNLFTGERRGTFTLTGLSPQQSVCNFIH